MYQLQSDFFLHSGHMKVGTQLLHVHVAEKITSQLFAGTGMLARQAK